jgi:broad specificity phosphatase PhoE
MGELILVRHGETEWSKSGQHTGRTDVPLTAEGEANAAALAPALARLKISAVFTSPASRAVRTAELAGLTGARQDPDLQEWDYGGYEGLTTAQIQASRPDWYLWRDGVIPGDAAHPGETIAQVGSRVDAVLGRVRPPAARADRPLAAARPVQRAAVPAGHRHAVHAGLRARRAGHPHLERPRRQLAQLAQAQRRTQAGEPRLRTGGGMRGQRASGLSS